MRMLPITLIKNCKFKLLRSTHINKHFSTETLPKVDLNKTRGDPNFVHILPSWKEEEEPKLRAGVLQGMQIIPDFVSEQEEAAIIAELEPRFKKLRYEFDHWDNAIEGYRETEQYSWRPENAEVVARIKSVAFCARDGKPALETLPHAHILDLSSAGFIRPHIDAVRFCGDVIAGLCLLSSAVMRLEHSVHKNLVMDALLQRRCLYIMKGTARYDFSHAVLGGEHSIWKGEKLRRQRRVAVICRSQPNPEDKK